ncbi:Splicing factor 3A subunit [Quillaja saponaria]|uniref:Splicing factor 3A subunit n=1 Tax=Quillaja saponaria TaxID=32244 RepID=A0AAD7LBP6_QUISA|nr:Splicing factor 3A subunit [Quillaja saponaria]
MLGSLPILPLPAPPSDGNLGPLPPSQVSEEQKDGTSPTEEQNQLPPAIGCQNSVPKINLLRSRFLQSLQIQLYLSQPHLFWPLMEMTAVSAKPDPSAQFRPVQKVLEPPEAEQYTVRLPDGITGEELDIIKLTAQFVARNGKSFLTGLTSREVNNPQFHFLKPTHSMFTFFTSLADAYSKVLMPPKGLSEKLRKSVTDMTTVLERCVNRLEWERSQEQARQKAEDEIEQERQQMAMIDWHDFAVVETIDFADDEDEDLPPPMTLEEVIRRSKMSAMEEDIVEPGKEVEMEMDEEEAQLVEEGMRAASLEDHDDEKNEMKVSEEPEPPMRIVKNWKRPEERIPVDRDPTKFVVSPIHRMFAKIRETTLAQDDEISKNIVGLARTRPDIFGTTEEEVSNAVKAEIEKKDEQPKQVIWDGHTGSIGRTANQAMSQNIGGEDQNDAGNMEARNLPGPAAPPPRPGVPSVRPLPPPPGLALNLPRVPPNTAQYSAANSGGLPIPPPMSRPPVMPMFPSIRPAQHPMPIPSGQQSMLMNRPPPMPPSISVNGPGIPVPPPPGSQFTPVSVPRPFAPLPVPPPKDQFLAQHPGPVRIAVSVPNVDEGNLRGQLLEITVQALSETVGSLKEKIAGEIQLPANKQKLSGKPGFLKDNISLAYYNIGAGDTLTLSLRERGGRKR